LIKSLLFFALGSLCSWLIELPYGGWLLVLGLGLFFRAIFSDTHPFRSTWIFSLGYFCNSLWWIFVSLHDIGGLPATLSILAVIALSAYLSLFYAAAVKLAYIYQSNTLRIIGIACSWVVFEWLRSQLFTGFPWAGFAESQVDGPFFAWAPLLGGLACTWLCVALAAYLSLGKNNFFTKVVATIVIISGSHALGLISFTQPIGRPIDLSLIQGNFAQTIKFDPAHISQQIEYYYGAIKGSKSSLVIAPETAIPVQPTRFDPLFENLKPKNSSQNVILGTVGLGPNGQFANSAIGLKSKGDTYQYDKSHLVPFGEYVPWGSQWFVDLFKVPLGNFYRGSDRQAPFIINQGIDEVAVGILICYEDVFGDELASRQRNSAIEHHLWVNLTNLAWFGDSQAAEQQLRLARLRSIETGVPTLRATNTGITSVIDHQGQVLRQLPKFQQGILKAEIQAYSGKTPYVWLGDTPILALSVLFLIMAWRKNKK